MGVPPGNRPAVPRDWFRGVPERYVAGADTRGRQEGRPYPWSQQIIHETSGLEHPDTRVHSSKVPIKASESKGQGIIDSRIDLPHTGSSPCEWL